MNEAAMPPSRRITNVGETERIMSVAVGSALALFGLSRRSRGGVPFLLFGSALVARGAMGYCPVYAATGTTTARPQAENLYAHGVQVESSFTIDRPVKDLYNFWHGFTHLPMFMDHLQSVTALPDGLTHWVAEGPLGTVAEWDAEVINDVADELIAWRSVEGSQIENAGSVHFTPATGGRGTVVRVVLRYAPPGGRIGAIMARLFGRDAKSAIEDDLRRFKQLMEAGEVPTTDGQSSGPRDDLY